MQKKLIKDISVDTNKGGDAMSKIITCQKGPQEMFLANPADLIIYGGA